jgi:hypothetical protein
MIVKIQCYKNEQNNIVELCQLGDFTKISPKLFWSNDFATFERKYVVIFGMRLRLPDCF